MRISVVIPTWNRRTLVQRAVQSVLAQSRPADEIVVVDDGSTDHTASDLREKFPRIAVLEQQNRGVSAARNAGVALSSGEWIALLDSDDEWLPDKLAAQVELIAAEPSLRICHTDELWIRNGRRVNPKNKHAKPEGDIFLDCLPLCCVSPSAVIIHRDIFKAVGTFDESLPACEDYDLWLRVFSRYPAGLVPQALVRKYGGHADQLSRAHWGMDRFRVAALDKLLRTDALEGLRREMAVNTLVEKCEILAAGADKRGKKDDAHGYRIMAQRWQC